MFSSRNSYTHELLPSDLLERYSVNSVLCPPLTMAAILHSTSPLESQLTLHKATTEDIPAIKSMLDAAYLKYIERIGKPPAPMTEDCNQVIRTHEILVLRDNEQIVGSITFHKDEAANSLKIDNVVVGPTAQGRGYGYYLIKCAEVEAQKQGLPSVTLFTNVKMFENIRFYAKLGFDETDRRMEDAFERVYFYKNLLLLRISFDC